MTLPAKTLAILSVAKILQAPISVKIPTNILFTKDSRKKNSKRKREFGESCRSILNEIRSFTFLLEDNEDLKNVVIKISKGQNEEQPSRRKRSPITKQKKE